MLPPYAGHHEERTQRIAIWKHFGHLLLAMCTMNHYRNCCYCYCYCYYYYYYCYYYYYYYYCCCCCYYCYYYYCCCCCCTYRKYSVIISLGKNSRAGPLLPSCAGLALNTVKWRLRSSSRERMAATFPQR